MADAINNIINSGFLNNVQDVMRSISVAPQDFQGGIGGFLFSIPTDDTLDLQSQITDYLIEENSSIEDNIALSPLTMTLNGVVSELKYSNREAEYFASLLQCKLGALDLISPTFSSKVRSYINESRVLYEQFIDSYEKANDTYKAIKGALGENTDVEMNEQQKAFNFFYSCWRSRKLLTVETPWAVFGDCALEGVNFSQPAGSDTQTQLSVRIKVLNFATTKSSTYFGLLAGRSGGQRSNRTNTKNGNTNKKQKQSSELYDIAVRNSRKQSSYGVNG